MRIKILLIALVLFLAGCGGRSEENTVLPTRAQSAVNGPRAVPDASTPDLPATWTPSPTQIATTPIPAGDPDTSVSNNTSVGAGQRTHEVKAGDTLGEIAQQYGVSLSDLVAANDIENINVIEVGTILIIPGG